MSVLERDKVFEMELPGWIVGSGLRLVTAVPSGGECQAFHARDSVDSAATNITHCHIFRMRYEYTSAFRSEHQVVDGSMKTLNVNIAPLSFANRQVVFPVSPGQCTL